MNSHLLMASGFAVAMVAMLSIRRYGQATLFLIALIETFVQLRYPFHLVMRDYLLRVTHGAVGKTELQVRLLVGATAVGMALLLLLTPRLARLTLARQLRLLGSGIVIALFGVELVSLHPIDAMIYRPIDSFALCAIIYFGGALVAAGGAVLEARRQPRVDLAI